MTKPKTPAQQAQQNNRTGDGKYTTKSHSEAEVGLPVDRQFTSEDHVELGESLMAELNEYTDSTDQTWTVDHNEDSQVSHVREHNAPDRSDEQDRMGYDETDLVFTIGVANHRPNSKILIDSEAASDGHDLAGLHPTEVDETGWLVSHYRSSYEADDLEDAAEWARGKIRTRLINDAYNARHEGRSEALDEMARIEGCQVLSSVQQDRDIADQPGDLAKSHHRFNYQDVPDEVFDNAVAIYSNTQAHHFGVGADEADELRSAYIVSAHQDEGKQKWLVSHAYGIHSNTEAEDGYRHVAISQDKDHAIYLAEQGAQHEIDSGSIAATNKNLGKAFEYHQEGHILAMDHNHIDGMIVIRKHRHLEFDRHHIE